ncbi:MAG: single-stranded DNA-binding protein [Bacteroidetes bacterium]|jgi:single-strand DNA-binding protein|nr:single-stranded DNA-binding protein [Bacteroidota bacterium]
MVNRVILIGNLGKDPEVRRLENGAVVAKFPVATNENYKDKSGEWQTITDWHDVVVWRTLAERAENTLTKGDQVYVEGKLSHRTWQDKDGNNRRTTEVVANYFRIVNRRDKSSGGGGGYFPSASDEMTSTPRQQQPAQPQETAQTAPAAEESDSGSSDDDLPF